MMNIQYPTAIILLLAFQSSIFAQRDTVYQTTRLEQGAYSAPLVETPSDRLFRTQVPANWMFKLNLAQIFTNFGNEVFQSSTVGTRVECGAEYKLTPAFSLGAYGGLSFTSNFPSDWEDQRWIAGSSFELEGRWYHDMKKRIRKGKGANNFNGKYLSLAGIYADNAFDLGSTSSLILRYGVQQRMLRYGYFDVNVGAGITTETSDFGRQMAFRANQQVSAGLAAFLPHASKTKEKDQLCEVLHCQDEQYQMLKINLFNAVNFLASSSIYSFSVRPNIAFEQKLGRSPFSVELDLAADYAQAQIAADKYYAIRGTTANWVATGELRWYYSMRKRILEGRSGNNLSGAFWGLQLQRNQLIKGAVNYESDYFNFIGATIQGDYWAGNVVWGMQQRLLERGFIQFKIGAGSTFGGNNYIYEGAEKSLVKTGRRNELNVLADLKVGFAF